MTESPPPIAASGMSPELLEARRRISYDLTNNIDDPCDVHELIQDQASSSDIDAFLSKSPLYSIKKKRFVCIPEKPTDASLVIKAFVKICEQVVKKLGGKPDKRNTREVENTLGAMFAHYRSNAQSSPNIVVKATGPSFESLDGDSELGYSNSASCFVVKLDGDDQWSTEEQAIELGIHAQQMFARHPNRKFVRCLFLTESRATLVHFDCAGAVSTVPVDIHKDPHAFINLVLAVSSIDEASLGFDTSVRWTLRKGKRTKGFVDVETAHGLSVTTYTLIKLRPISCEMDKRMVGRGTTVWAVEHPSSKEFFVIKDQFRHSSEATTAEGRFLSQAYGIDGVAQMVAYNSSRRTISGMRNGRLPDGNLYDRIESRIVMEMYGKSIGYFESEFQLLAALRDAIDAHFQLFCDQGILHRDISLNNILLGIKGALKGARGKLIDFDVSAFLEDLLIQTPCYIGTLTTQSVAVLRRWEPEHHLKVKIHHDHLDDLESFFYILLYLTKTMEAPGTIKDFMSYPYGLISVWDSEDRGYAADCKYDIFSDDKELDLGDLSEFWSPSTKQLLQSFLKFLRPTVIWKEGLRSGSGIEEQRETQAELVEQAEEHYTAVLRMFDNALDEMENAQSAPKAPLSTRNPNVVGQGPFELKRKAENEGEDVNGGRKRRVK